MRVRMFDWKGLLIAIAAAGFGLWFLQPGGSGRVEARVGIIAARMAAVTPQAMADGSTLRSVAASGRTILLTIDGRQPWQLDMSDEDMAAAMAAELCAQADLRALIGQGAQVRIEGRTPQGEALPPLTVDRCLSV